MKTGDLLLLTLWQTKRKPEKKLQEKRQSRISVVLRIEDAREKSGEDCTKVQVKTNSSHKMIALAPQTIS